VHLFNLGSTTQIGEDSVTISADVHVGALRKAIIHEFPDTAGGEANKLVVKPTLGGEALTPLTTKLSAVKFHLKDDGFLHAYVDVAPKPEGSPAGPLNAPPSATGFDSKLQFVGNLGASLTIPIIDLELKADVVGVPGADLANIAPTNENLNLFLRKGAREELKFLQETTMSPLIYGPPGTGKSVVAWLFALLSAQQGKRVLWHHYELNNFSACLLAGNQIEPIRVQQDIKADILILDGIVRDTMTEISAGLAWRNKAEGRNCV